MLQLLTEGIVVENSIGSHSRYAHFKVAGSAVENALRSALLDDHPRRLEEIAKDLGYRRVEPLKNRYPDLCRQLAGRRRVWLENSSIAPCTPVPRERIEQALAEALNEAAPVSLRSVAEKVGLHNRRRLYKGFHDVRRALVAKNQHLSRLRADAIESAVRAALNETPVPTVTEVARRLGFKSVTGITKRFPDLSATLKRRRQEASKAQYSSTR
jgi:AraC-like DNA-binding protein